MARSYQSRKALIRYAVGSVILTLVFTLFYLTLLYSKSDKHSTLWIPVSLLFSACSAVFYFTQLSIWGRTIREEAYAVTLPFSTRLEIQVPPFVPLRVILFLRDDHGLPSLEGSIKVLSSQGKLLTEKTAFKSDNPASGKTMTLEIPNGENKGLIVVELDLDWKPPFLDLFDNAPSKDHLCFDIITKAKESKS